MDFLFSCEKNISNKNYEIRKRIYEELGLTATAGIGTNLFLCKVALDIKAKKIKDNVAFLDEETFKKELWDHKPLSDFWQIAHGIESRLIDLEYIQCVI